MSTPHKCPVCEGSGLEDKRGDFSKAIRDNCPACKGTCVVWSSDEPVRYVFELPEPIPLPPSWPVSYVPWWQPPQIMRGVTTCGGSKIQ